MATLATVGWDWGLLSAPSQAAVEWAAGIAVGTAEGARGPLAPVGSRSLLLGIIRSHPRSSPPERLVEHYGQSVDDLVAALTGDASEGDAFTSAAVSRPSLTDYPPLDEYVERALRWALEKQQSQQPVQRVPLSYLFGGLLFTRGSAAARALVSVIGREELESVRSTYDDYLQLGDSVDYQDFLAERHSRPPGTEPGQEAAGSAEATPTTVTPELFRRSFGGYASDLAVGPDRLGIEQDVESLSVLLAARAIEPPISVGLFGDWGTGKSFFMDSMQRRIRAYAADAAAAEQAYRAGERDRLPDFHSRIKQITFNAWHYADANLWAGLVIRIFEGLAEPDTEEEVEARDRRRMEEERLEILRRLESASELHREAAARRKAAAARRSKAEKELSALRRRQAAVRRRLAQLSREDAPPVELEDLLRPTATAVQEATGLPVSATVEGIEEVSGRLRFLGTRLALAWRRSWGTPGRRRAMLAGAAAAVALVLLGVWLLATGRISGVAAFLGSVLAGAAGIVPGFMDALARVNDASLKAELAVRDAERRREEAERRQSERLVRREADLRARLDQLAAEETRVRAAEQQAAIAVEEAERDLADIRAGRRLYRFIEERAASSEYQRYVGLIGLIRRDFQELARLMKRAQREREAGARLSDPALPRIDRIILYIDDLDRCPANRVVEVLEAVHLLLAFPLFAVVVGVDSRWLLRSLQRHYAAQLSSVAERNGGSVDDSQVGGMAPQELAHWAATPQSYLEKIFQIPFTIRRMNDVGFGRLLDDLFKGSVADPPGTAKLAAPDKPRTAEAGGTDGQGAIAPPDQHGAGDPSTPSPGGVALQSTGHAPAEEPALPTIDLNPESLQIERTELTFIKKLSPMISTPRAAKRLVNTYRLIRTALDQPDLDRLLGRHGRAAEYPVALALLGVLIGFPGLAHEFFEELLHRFEGATWHEFLETLPRREQAVGDRETWRERQNGSKAEAALTVPSPATTGAETAAAGPLPPDPERRADAARDATAPLLDGRTSYERDAARPSDAREVILADALTWRQLESGLAAVGPELSDEIGAYRRWALVVTRYSFQTVRLVARGEAATAES